MPARRDAAPRWLVYLVVAGGFVSGVVVARVVEDFPFFDLDRSIDLVALAALIFSGVVSLALFRRLERLKLSDQLRKQALISRLARCFDALTELERTLSGKTSPFPEVVSRLGSVWRAYSGYTDYRAFFGEAAAGVERTSVQTRYLVLRDLLTNTPRDGSPDDYLVVVDDVLTMSRDQRVLVDRAVDDMRNSFSELEVDVIKDV